MVVLYPKTRRHLLEYMWKLEGGAVHNTPLRGPEHDLFTTMSLWSYEDTCVAAYSGCRLTAPNTNKQTNKQRHLCGCAVSLVMLYSNMVSAGVVIAAKSREWLQLKRNIKAIWWGRQWRTWKNNFKEPSIFGQFSPIFCCPTFLVNEPDPALLCSGALW